MESIFKIGMFLKAYDNASNVFRRMSNSAINDLSRLQMKMRDISQGMQQFGQTSLLTGGAITAPVIASMKAFADLEEASVHLQSTLMNNLGNVPPIFQKINREAIDLGNRLPGTTQDFYKMSAILSSLGVSSEAIAGGALRASAYLGVVLRSFGVSYEEAAEAVAKFKEAMGISEKELIPFMDRIQKTVHLGVRLGEMKYAFSALGGTLKTFKIQGLEAADALAPLVGMIIKMGVSGERTGTGLRRVIQETMDFKKIDEANKALSGFGIRLDFMDIKTGEFRGIENMIAQFTKLQALTPVQQQTILKKIFGGGEDQEIAAMIVSKGVAGYKEMQEQMKAQADLNQRVANALGTLKSFWDALTGTFKNTMAIIGESVAPGMKRLSDFLNDLSARIGTFMENHKMFTKIMSYGTLVVGGASFVLGGLALALGAIFNMSSYAVGGIKNFIRFIQWGIPWIKMKRMEILRLIGVQKAMNYITYHGGFWKAMQFFLLTTKYRLLETVAAMRAWIATQLIAARSSFLSISGLRSMASAFGSTLLTGLKAAIMGVRAFSLALVTTPIGWIALAIAAAAFLIYKFWKPISGFFRGLWAGIKEGLKGIEPAWNVFKKIAPLLFPIIWPLKMIYKLIKWLIKPVEDTGKAAENLGFRIGKVIGNIIKTFVTLPYKMFELGASLINSLWKGIASLANKPVEAIKNIGKATIQAFKGLLGIASPSKVFADFGSQIAQGVNLGMVAGGGRVAAASRFMTQPILQPIKSAPAPAFRAVGGGDITLHFHFTLPKGTDSETAQRIIKTSGMEIERVMRRKYAI